MNEGSTPSSGKTKLDSKLNTKKNRITVVIIDIALLLNKELKKNVTLRTAA